MMDVYKWSRENWDKLHPMVRADCLGQLRAEVPEDVLAAWKAQHAAGQEIGSGDVMFHFGVGMAIRNTLRKMLTDGELPPVDYFFDAKGNSVDRDADPPPDGLRVVEARNWDDYYMGALQELVETS